MRRQSDYILKFQHKTVKNIKSGSKCVLLMWEESILLHVFTDHFIVQVLTSNLMIKTKYRNLSYCKYVKLDQILNKAAQYDFDFKWETNSDEWMLCKHSLTFLQVLHFLALGKRFLQLFDPSFLQENKLYVTVKAASTCCQL